MGTAPSEATSMPRACRSSRASPLRNSPQTLWRGVGSRSINVTLRPFRASAMAAAQPATPPPMTRTSSCKALLLIHGCLRACSQLGSGGSQLREIGQCATVRLRPRGEFVPVESEVDQNDGGQGEGDDANRRQYVAKMAPVGWHKIEHTTGDKDKGDRIGAGHPLAVHDDPSVTRGYHCSTGADDPCSTLHGGPRQPGTSGGEGDPGKGADDDADEVRAAHEALELHVTLPKARRELQRAGQQSEGSAERVRDEQSAAGYDLQAVSVVHGVIGEQKDL